jgi:hypothetical protein
MALTLGPGKTMGLSEDALDSGMRLFKKKHGRQVKPMRQPSYWIIGGGRFGRLACERLQIARPEAKFVVVDHREINVFSGIERVTADAVGFLTTNMQPDSATWIVPAIPIHLAYEWFVARLRHECHLQPRAVPMGLVPLLPNACVGPNGQVYLSNADFRCPDDCPEPSDVCLQTGKPRPRIMHTFLANLAYGEYQSFVIRSHQLAPGVGGYQAATLFEGLERLQRQTGRFLFSTACKCHAVMHAFSLD